jgi:hypothetical protein
MLTKEQKKLILSYGFKKGKIPNYFFKKWEDKMKELKNYKDIRYELIITDYTPKKLILGVSYTAKLKSRCEDRSCVFAEGDFDYIINIIKTL